MKNNKKNIIIKINSEYYSKDAIITTCCQFLKDSYVFLEKVPRSSTDIRVILTLKDTKPMKAIEKIREEFNNELVNNTLRYNIAEKNKDIREYIIKSALFFSQYKEPSDSLLFQDFDNTQEDNWKDDPLGISIPWKKKHKQKKKTGSRKS